jgi:Flp pilus assembly CpaE family ATPase
MIQSILISPDESLNGELTAALQNLSDVEIVRALTIYPSLDDLLRTIRVRKPRFLFVSIEDFPAAAVLAGQMDDFLPGLPIVAIGRHLEIDVMPKLMHLGVREYLTSPINPSRLAEVIDSTRRLLKRRPAQASLFADLYTFLPAKPGVGCSTIAVSTSCALADDLGARTLADGL